LAMIQSEPASSSRTISTPNGYTLATFILKRRSLSDGPGKRQGLLRIASTKLSKSRLQRYCCRYTVIVVTRRCIRAVGGSIELRGAIRALPCLGSDECWSPPPAQIRSESRLLRCVLDFGSGSSTSARSRVAAGGTPSILKRDAAFCLLPALCR
jgi:hypothetical protein